MAEKASLFEAALDRLLDDMDSTEGHAATAHSVDECPNPLSCTQHDEESMGNLAPDKKAAIEIEVHKDPKHLAEGGEAPMDLHLKKGALHKELGVSDDERIPGKKLDKALDSDNPLERKRAQFAENAKHWDHKADGGEIEGLSPEDLELLKKHMR